MTTLASRQTALGDYVYFFTSPQENTRDCAILAHAACVQGRYFDLPVGVTMKFAVAAGQKNGMPQGPIGSAMGITPSPFTKDRLNLTAGGHRCLDQVLGKILGSHWSDEKTRADGEYYELLQDQMMDNARQGKFWTPHIVVIRNRKKLFSNDYIWLSKVISLVRAHDANVSQFYSLGCRGYEGGRTARQAGAQAYQG
ncbi:hypothetical protein V8J88_01425 [Massilia sp. W12]|uniref:hypothetical protein n=1 Tax=Massilia sp. W12 TaxID=3126507 RepID=UPI0030D52FA2